VLLSVSVDLDEICHYYAIHGLPEQNAEKLIYRRAVPRLADWAAQRGLLLTWFVIGRDAEAADNAQALSRLASAGHEMGCHSYSHHYDLTLRSAGEMRSEVERGVSVLEQLTGGKVRGFRAPGYIVNDTLLALLREAGLAYDSSVFPCPAYYALKSAAIAAQRAGHRTSRAVVDSPQVLRAPTTPYRVGQPYWFRGAGIWEIPIQVTTRARLPFIGTALTMAGPAGARLLTRGVLGAPFVNLELHGIDVLDQSDGLIDLAKHQRDLRIGWSKKLDAIDAAVALLRNKGYATVRLDELAAQAAGG
jgi:peptidoglycan/xylan/chitin deacetylase (PgdA/CDA1 family)